MLGVTNVTSADNVNSGSTVTCSLTGLDLIRISQEIGLSFFEATPLTKTLRVFTKATSESESRESESRFTERIFSFMARTLSVIYFTANIAPFTPRRT